MSFFLFSQMDSNRYLANCLLFFFFPSSQMDIRRDIFCVFYIYEEGAGTCHHQEKDLYVGLSIYIYKISHVDCLIAFLVRGQEPLWRRSGQKMGTCGIILGQTTFSSKKTILSSTQPPK